MAAFNRIKVGDVLWESRNDPWIGWENWEIHVLEIDPANRTAMCSRDGNSPRLYYEHELKRLRRTPKEDEG